MIFDVVGVLVLVVLPAALVARVLFSPRARLRRYLVASAPLWCWARLNLDALLNPRYAPTNAATYWMVAIGMPLFMLFFYACAALAAARVWGRQASVAIVGVSLLVLGASLEEHLLLLPSLAIPPVFTVVVFRRVGAPQAEPRTLSA
jgi:hypothetical protein